MKLSRKYKFYYALLPVLGAGTFIQLKLLGDGVYNSTSPYYYLVPIATIIVSAFTLLKFSKPLATVNNEILSIEGQEIYKNTVEYMSYEIESDQHHIVSIKMEGFSAHEITLENKRKELDEMRLFNFISENFYPIQLVNNDKK